MILIGLRITRMGFNFKPDAEFIFRGPRSRSFQVGYIGIISLLQSLKRFLRSKCIDDIHSKSPAPVKAALAAEAWRLAV